MNIYVSLPDDLDKLVEIEEIKHQEQMELARVIELSRPDTPIFYFIKRLELTPSNTSKELLNRIR